MALVHEAAGDRAGTGIQILVVAPHREIDPAVVQCQFNVADRVGKVDAADRALRVGEAHDLGNVERLPAAVLHAGPQHQREARAVFGDRACDRRHRERIVSLVGLQFDQVGGRIEAVEADLRFHRVAVGRERAGLHQDRRALAGRAVEADHHQVQVGGQRVHRDHFLRLRADQPRERLAHELVVGHPLRGLGEVAFDRFGRPLVQHFLDVLARRPGLQAQRVTNEIRLRAAVVHRDMEFAAQRWQRIGRIERVRVVVGVLSGHDLFESLRPSSQRKLGSILLLLWRVVPA